MPLDPTSLEQLLHEAEGAALDFKQAQYRFDGADVRTKSELLKDILSFVNSWRRETAYILTGVKEHQGGRSEVVGVTEHLDDASLQQFVNSKTQRPVQMLYYVLRTEGTEIGVIEIPVQPRPIWLRKQYGKLESNTVYLRRGSSTSIAVPDEIARMGEARVRQEPLERIKLYLNEHKEWLPLPRDEEGGAGSYYAAFPEFTFRYVDAEDCMARNEEWTRAEVRTDDNHAGYVALYYHHTCLKRVRYVSFDNHKKSMVAPTWRPIGRGRFYFYEQDSIEYAVQKYMVDSEEIDHSRTLNVGGEGEASQAARQLWPRYMGIPVVRAQEVKEFLNTSPTNQRDVSMPSRDPIEQYQLFLRNQCDFENWRRKNS